MDRLATGKQCICVNKQRKTAGIEGRENKQFISPRFRLSFIYKSTIAELQAFITSVALFRISSMA